MADDIHDFAVSDDTIPSGIDAVNLGNTVPAERFPLTPEEAWMIMRGYWVKPTQPVDVERLLTLPGLLEMTDAYIGLLNK